ncbi:hypothetical protein D3C71_324940 [compost metagenome]
MSGNSLASLLAWMRTESRMEKWGLVVALERNKTNLIILQEYIRRFGANSYFPPITAKIETSANMRSEMVQDFVMDAPVLSFENANLNDSKAMLTMSVISGFQSTLDWDEGWKVKMLNWIDPLQGPKLHLDLELNRVPGNVDDGGQVILDLRESSNFRLTFASDSREQVVGGDFFKDLFDKMEPAKRIWELGKIERGSNALMRPQSFILRTQASGAAARDPQSLNFGDGAVLALVRFEGKEEGYTPNSSYKYLIPDDAGADYSATVLLNKRMVAGSAILQEMTRILQSNNIEYQYDQGGNLLKAMFMSGSVTFPDADYTRPAQLPDGTVVNIGLKSKEFEFSASSAAPLIVDFAQEKVSISWKPTVITECTFTTSNQEPGIFRVQIDMDMLLEYELVEEQGVLLLKRTRGDFVPAIKFIDLPASDDEEKNAFWLLIALLILVPMTAHVLGTLVIMAKLQIDFMERFNSEASIAETISEIVKLNFGSAIQGSEIHAPHDIGFFGRINPQQTSFLVNPMRPLVKQGQDVPFTTTPVVSGVKWKVENLLEGPGDPGTINADSGRYLAPASVQGGFTRVRVTATAPGTGYSSSALVTIVANDFSIHPLIQKCDAGKAVELKTGQLGEGEIRWSIKNPVPGNSGELKPSTEAGGDQTYHAGEADDKKTYLLEEIEAKNMRTNQTRSSYVLVFQKKPGISVKIVSTDIAKGEVQLEAVINGNIVAAEWSMPLSGQGAVDQNGLYRSQTTSSRFALVFAAFEVFPVGTFEGHVILPLPLVEFPAYFELAMQ